MKMRSASLFLLPTLAVVLFAVRASAIPIGNIVKNGNFETGGLPPWKTSGNTGGSSAFSASAVNNGAFGVDGDAHTGSFAAFAHPRGSLGYLSQSLQTTQGTVYELSFWLSASSSQAFSAAAAAGQPLTFQIFWNGSLIFQQTTAFSSTYSHYDFVLPVATSSRTNLKFGFRNNSGEFHLDDVIVGVASVPEAFSTLWLGIPVLIVLIAARKRPRLRNA
jgi:hypothetical protein